MNWAKVFLFINFGGGEGGNRTIVQRLNESEGTDFLRQRKVNVAEFFHKTRSDFQLRIYFLSFPANYSQSFCKFLSNFLHIPSKFMLHFSYFFKLPSHFSRISFEFCSYFSLIFSIYLPESITQIISNFSKISQLT